MSVVNFSNNLNNMSWDEFITALKLNPFITLVVLPTQNLEYKYTINLLHDAFSEPKPTQVLHIHLLGDSKSGKSLTAQWLIKLFQKAKCQRKSKFGGVQYKIRQNAYKHIDIVKGRTRGIQTTTLRFRDKQYSVGVAEELPSKEYMIVIHDYGGQEELLSSHAQSLAVENSVYVIVVPTVQIGDSIEQRHIRTLPDIIDRYLFWCRFVYSVVHKQSDYPVITGQTHNGGTGGKKVKKSPQGVGSNKRGIPMITLLNTFNQFYESESYLQFTQYIKQQMEYYLHCHYSLSNKVNDYYCDFFVTNDIIHITDNASNKDVLNVVNIIDNMLLHNNISGEHRKAVILDYIVHLFHTSNLPVFISEEQWKQWLHITIQTFKSSSSVYAIEQVLTPSQHQDVITLLADYCEENLVHMHKILLFDEALGVDNEYKVVTNPSILSTELLGDLLWWFHKFNTNPYDITAFRLSQSDILEKLRIVDWERKKDSNHGNNSQSSPIPQRKPIRIVSYIVGAKVEVDQYMNGRYVSGTITACTNSNEGIYDITYDDGLHEKDVKWFNIRWIRPFKEGQYVEVNHQNKGKFYPCMISCVNSDNTYRVVFMDGRVGDNISRQLIRQPLDNSKLLPPPSTSSVSLYGNNSSMSSSMNSSMMSTNSMKLFPTELEDGTNTVTPMRSRAISAKLSTHAKKLPSFMSANHNVPAPAPAPTNAPAYPVGSRVEADLYERGKYLTAIVSDYYELKGTYDITYEEDQIFERDVKACNIRWIDTYFEIGQEIEANYKGKGKFYRGTITFIHSKDSTYRIIYHDGSNEDHVPRQCIRHTMMRTGLIKMFQQEDNTNKDDNSYHGDDSSVMSNSSSNTSTMITTSKRDGFTAMDYLNKLEGGLESLPLVELLNRIGLGLQYDEYSYNSTYNHVSSNHGTSSPNETSSLWSNNNETLQSWLLGLAPNIPLTPGSHEYECLYYDWSPDHEIRRYYGLSDHRSFFYPGYFLTLFINLVNLHGYHCHKGYGNAIKLSKRYNEDNYATGRNEIQVILCQISSNDNKDPNQDGFIVCIGGKGKHSVKYTIQELNVIRSCIYKHCKGLTYEEYCCPITSIPSHRDINAVKYALLHDKKPLEEVLSYIMGIPNLVEDYHERDVESRPIDDDGIIRYPVITDPIDCHIVRGQWLKYMFGSRPRRETITSAGTSNSGVSMTHSNSVISSLYTPCKPTQKQLDCNQYIRLSNVQTSTDSFTKLTKQLEVNLTWCDIFHEYHMSCYDYHVTNIAKHTVSLDKMVTELASTYEVLNDTHRREGLLHCLKAYYGILYDPLKHDEDEDDSSDSNENKKDKKKKLPNKHFIHENEPFCLEKFDEMIHRWENTNYQIKMKNDIENVSLDHLIVNDNDNEGVANESEGEREEDETGVVTSDDVRVKIIRQGRHVFRKVFQNNYSE